MMTTRHRGGMLAALALFAAAGLPEPIMAGAVQPGGAARRAAKPEDWRDLTPEDRERIYLAQIRRDHKNLRRWRVMDAGARHYHPKLKTLDFQSWCQLSDRTHRLDW